MTRDRDREHARRVLAGRDRADAWCREIGLAILPGTHRDLEQLADDDEKDTDRR